MVLGRLEYKNSSLPRKWHVRFRNKVSVLLAHSRGKLPPFVLAEAGLDCMLKYVLLALYPRGMVPY